VAYEQARASALHYDDEGEGNDYLNYDEGEWNENPSEDTGFPDDLLYRRGTEGQERTQSVGLEVSLAVGLPST
jgi:hypothetical protein